MMNLMSWQRYRVVLNLILIAAIAWYGAQIVNDIVSRRLASPLASAPSARLLAHQAATSRPRSYYNVIVQRDIFNLEPAKVPAAKVVVENLHLKLLGTSLMTHGEPFAIIQDQNSGQENLYRRGDEIPNAGKLVAVEKSRALIRHNGHLVAIELPKDQLPEPVPNGPHSPATRYFMRRESRADVTAIGEHRYIVRRSVVSRSMQNMAQLFSEIRAVPHFENGASNGFALSEIQPGSVFDKIGLRDGDVLTSVNGQTVADPGRAMQLLYQLKNEQAVTLNLIRDGQPIQLHYNIR